MLENARPRWLNISMDVGIYVHIPYCVRKCRYCDFASSAIAGREGTVGPYIGGLKDGIRRTAEHFDGRLSVSSVFFGGGTPSLIDAGLLCSVLDEIRKCFTVTQDAEISLEANPGTLTEGKLAAYRKAGFNRLSLGIQSLDDRVLAAMGRIHDSREAAASFRLASRFFDNINADLMLGVPLQTERIWTDTLERAIDLGPSHLSFYSLQLEEGTPFYDDYRAGRLELPSWEENRAMYHKGLEIIRDAGFVHYEISNGALPGRECRHNLRYWTMEPFLGFGSAAHSFIGGVRYEGGALPFAVGEDPDETIARSRSFTWAEGERLADLKGDFLFTQLRLIEGMDTGLYQRLFGTSIESDVGGALEELEADGLIETSEDRIRLTEKGLDMTNPIEEKLLEAL